MLVAGEEANESLSTWPRAAAARQSPESERVASERDRTRREEGCRSSGRKGKQASTAEKKNARASCGPFFQFR